jgi:hypothetical protein
MITMRAAAAPFTPKANAGQVAFIDTGVLGWETLRDALPLGIEAVLVAPEADGVAVLAASLAGRRGVEAIHVLSHGFAGGFTLGAARVDRASLAERAETWSAIGESLAADGDILIYSCSVASGAGGDFLDELAAITGANLAASRTLTGAAELGGDWNLGWVRGAVSTPSLEVAGFAGVLAAPVMLQAKAVNGSDKIYVQFDQPLDEANPPLASAISAGGSGGYIMFNSSFMPISGVEVSGDTLIITYSTTFTTGDTIAFTYVDPTLSNDPVAVQNLDGEDAETFPVSFTVAQASAPELTAIGEDPVFNQGSGAGVGLFGSVNVSTEDFGQLIVGVTFTITNVSDDTEMVTWDGSDIPLTDGAIGTFGDVVRGGPYDVSIVGGTATINVVGLSYTPEDFAALVDAMEYKNTDASATAGARVISITQIIDDGVDNGVSPLTGVSTTVTVGTPPALVSTNAYIGESFFTLVFDQQLDPNNPPPANAFSMTVNGAPIDVTGVEVDGSGMGLRVQTLAIFAVNEVIDFAYADPTVGDDASAIQNLDGLDAASIPGGTLTTVSTARPVEFESAEVNGQFLTLTYSGALASLPTADLASFQVQVDGMPMQVNSVLVDGPAGTVTLVLNEAVVAGQTVVVSYNDPSFGDDTYALQGADGVDMASIVLATVDNVTLLDAADDVPPVATGNVSNPGLTDGGGAHSTVFQDVTVDMRDIAQLITGMVLTVHNVAADTEALIIDGQIIYLQDGNSGASMMGFDYAVTVDNGVATVTLSDMAAFAAEAAVLIEGIEYADTGGPGMFQAQPGGAVVRPVVLRSITDNGADGFNTTEVDLVSTVTISRVSDGSPTYALTAQAMDPTTTFVPGTPTTVEFLVTFYTAVDLTNNTLEFAPVLPPGWTYDSLSVFIMDTETLQSTGPATVGGLVTQGVMFKVTFNVTSSGTDTGGTFPVSLSSQTTIVHEIAMFSASTMMLVDPPDTAPTLTATGETPEFEGGSTTPVSLFTAVTADAEDVGQSFTGLTLTVTGVVDDTETLTIGSVQVALIDGVTLIPGLGVEGTDATATVTIIGTTATVTVTALDLNNAEMGTLIGSLAYENTDPDATIGDRVITVTQVTDEGIVNTGTITGVSATVTVTDVTDPDAPVVTSAALTNDTTPVITGTAEEGATITLTIAGATYTTVATGGTWSVDLGAATPVSGTLNPDVNGDNDYTVTATDASSNISETTNGTLTIDTTAPAVPAITSAALTNDATPVITGTAEEGATVTVTVAATIYTTVATGGVWSIDLATDVPTGGSSLALDPNGENLVYVQATDAAGNVSSSYATQQLIIDTTPPAEPAITSVALTNDTTPVITGTAEAGATVTVTVGGATYSTVATAGVWSIDLGTAVPDDGTLALDANGDNLVSAIATDAAGNQSLLVGTQTLVIDTTRPAVPAITSAALTNDTTPVISGTAEAGATVTLYVNSATYTAVATGGVWSIDLATAVPDDGTLVLDVNGDNTVTVFATDVAGNMSATGGTQTLTIDTTRPATATITSAALTNDATPVISGTAEDGATVTVTVAGATYTTVATGGVWSIDLATDVPTGGSGLALDLNGDNAVYVQATDTAGNVSAAPATQTLIIDTTPPAEPAITSVALTNDTTPVITGTAEAGATVTVTVGGATYSTVATAGVWSIDLETAVPDDGTLELDVNGDNAVSATAEDAAGNVSATAGTQTLVIDTTRPAPPAITSAALTNDATPVISGTAEEGATVTLIVGGATYTTVATGGAWSVDLETAVPIGGTLLLDPNGDNPVVAGATDAAGNTSVTGDTQTLVIDTTLPAAPVISSAALTNDATPVISGTAEVGATVTVTVAGATYSVVATGGVWSIDLETAEPASGTLALDVNGDNPVVAIATDAAGNVSATAGTQTLAIDTGRPAAPVITSSALTNDTTPVITGTAEEGATVTVIVGGATYSTVATGGVWSIDLETASQISGTLNLNANGNNTVSAIATDIAGNVSILPTFQTLVIDTTEPAAPAITSAALTNDATPVISGTAEAGATVTVTVGGATYSTVATGGVWSIDLETATPVSGTLLLNDNGDNPVSATATDMAGNISATAGNQTLVIDTTRPAAPVITSAALSNDATPVISGTAEDGATVTVTVAGATYSTVATGGVWSIDLETATPASGTLDLETEGDNLVSAIATDAAGNASAAAGIQILAIDAELPDAPVITSAALTTDATPVISGTAEAGATVTVTVGGAIYSTVATGGVWSIDLETAVPGSGTLALDVNGDNAVSATATDAAGNVSATAATQTLAIDTTVPDAPAITSAAVTNDATPVISGTAEDGATVTVTVAGATYSTVATGGVWSIDLETATPASGALLLDPNGDNAVSAVAADAAGNVSAPAGQTLAIDTTLPAAPTITSAALTNDATPVISGTAEEGATVTLIVAGATYSTVATGGVWSIDLETAVPDAGTLELDVNGENLVAALATDTAGNTSATGAIQTLAIDAPPDAPVITSAALTNDATPVISGTAEDGATVTVTVAGATYSAVATGGVWSIDLETAMPDDGTLELDVNGENTVSATASDGTNSSAPSIPQTLVIDTTLPDAPVITSDAATTSARPVISGTAEAGVTVTVTVGGATYSTVATGGVWSIDLDTAVPDEGELQLDIEGDNAVSVTATDAAGNLSETAGTQTLAIDAVLPDAPVITSAALTNDATPVISGTAEDGATVTVTVGGATYSTVATGGVWSIDLETTVPDDGTLELDVNGDNAVSAFAKDAAGNVSASATTQTLTIDTVVPDAPVITSPALTNDATPVISGTAEAGVTVTVMVAGAIYTTVATGGVWSIDLGATAPDDGTLELDVNGENAVSAFVTDAAGNVSGSTDGGVTIDTTRPGAPAITSAASTTSATPVISGTAEAGATVTVQVGGATYVTVATDGVWSIDLGTEPDAGELALDIEGDNLVLVSVTDAAGNVTETPATQTLAIDAVTPDAPVITSPAVTNSAAPTIAGTAENGTTVTVTVAGATYAVVAIGGAWSIDLATATPIEGSLALDLDGENTVSVTATDAGGNVSTAASQDLVIDAIAPDPGIIIGLAAGSDSGIAGDGITTVTAPTITGLAEAGALVVLLDTDGTTVLGSATADEGGAWSITSSTLALGNHVLTVEVTDSLGNASDLSDVFVVDIVASDLPPIYVSSPEYPSQVVAKFYEGPVEHLVYEFIGSSSGEAVVSTDDNDFVNLAGGDDAADGGDGDDVLDGGVGSNFLTGGAGADVFFLDGRGGEITWSTITDWQAGEQLAVWGWRPGESTAIWVEDAGAEGYRGVTMHADLDANGTIDTSVTWAGLTRADLPTPTEQDGLLWFA